MNDNNFLSELFNTSNELKVKNINNDKKNKRAYEIKVDLSNIKNEILDTKAIFIKGDKETSVIYADVIINEKPFDLNGYSVILNVMNDEDNAESYECEIADEEKGRIKIKLPNVVLDKNGICVFDLSFVKNNSIINSQRYSYLVLKSVGLYDLSQDTVDNNILFKLIEEVKKLKTQNEDFINSATTSEESRINNEEVRKTQENARQESIKNMKKTIDEKTLEINKTKNELISNVNNSKEKMLVEVNNKIAEINESKNNLFLEVNNAKEDMINKVDNKILEMQENFNSSSSNENKEIIQEIKTARDGESSLNERIKRDIKTIKREILDNTYSKNEVDSIIQSEITSQRVRGISIANSLLSKL